MKTITRFKWMPAVLLLSLSLQVFPQTDPAAYYNRLFYLCKVWGHAKYFHTEVAKGPGTINWDNQLLTAIEATRTASSDTEFNAILLQMLNSAGPMGTSTVPLPTVPDELNINKDHSWMDSPIYSTEVKAKLKEIQDKFRPQANFYVTKLTRAIAVFDSDNQYYEGGTYPSEGLRLLSLFRFWNIHNYFLPYKYQMVNNIDGLLTEFIPRMVEAANELEYHLSIKELTGKIVDSHSMTFSPVVTNWDGTSYPPFLVKLVENKTVVTKVLPGAPVAVGDVIDEIDGSGIDELRAGLWKYGFGSNDPAINYTVTYMIMWGADGTYPLKASNESTTYMADFTRNATNNGLLVENTTPRWTTRTVAGSTYGIVDMARLEVADAPTMFSDLWNTRAIIFDIRGYPKSTLWTIVNYLFPGPIHIADFTCPDVKYPGTLYWHNEYIGTGTQSPYSGKVLMLFDERARSQSEYTTMGLELFPDAIKIGNTTAGADADITYVYLPGNCYVIMNGLGCFYPDGTQRSRQGIIPDYEVHPTIAGIRAGRDELMEFALNPALLNVHPDYCTSVGNATTEWISSVTLGTNSNSSGSSATIGYQNFQSPVFTVESGKSYTIKLQPGYTKVAFENWSVWIDFNGDEGFDETGELVFSKSRSKTLVSGTVVIPSGLALTTRMRVSMSSSVMPGPCSQLSTGEVEDYTLIISTPVPDPLVADFTANPVNLEVGNTVQFTDRSTGSPTGWQWSFPGGTPSASTLQNPSVLYNQVGDHDVTLTVTRNASNNSMTKTKFISVTEKVILPYCIPVSVNSSQDYIKTVLISGVINNTTVGTGYYLYEVPTAFTPGSVYPVTLTPNNSTYRNYWKVWIDFNKDGDFLDSGENVLTASNKRGPFSSSITIPATASGSTRMRISMRSGAIPQPCDGNFIGEVEDYNIILGSPGLRAYSLTNSNVSIVNNNGTLRIYPNPVSQNLTIQVDELQDQNELAIYSMEGKLVRKERLTSDRTMIDVSKWEKGIYLIRFNGGGLIVNRKFVKN